MDHGKKFAMTLDYLLGKGASANLPRESLTYVLSPRTGRVRTVWLDRRLIGTLRPDGGVALTILGAKLLEGSKAFDDNCVTITGEAVEFVSQGRSVFARHVRRCGRNISPGGEAIILSPRGEIVAVGRSILSAKMMRSFKRGVAVKVRQGTTRAPRAGSPLPGQMEARNA